MSEHRHNHSSDEVCHHDCPAYDAMLAEKTRARHNVPRVQNARGEWVPAIPLPHYLAFGRVRCDCGRKFRNQGRYREHFAYAHTLGMEASA